MKCAPIALFAYNRPNHFQRAIQALQKNDLAEESELHIFCDAPRSPADAPAVSKVKDFAREARGFKRVHIVEQTKNLGLARSIISGVTSLVTHKGRIIVVEDDLVTSPYFLRFMNEGLEFYAGEPEVASIHGYVYPVAGPLPETFFIRGADCWGWATWQRAWSHFNPSSEALIKQIETVQLQHRFDYDGAAPNMRMLREHLSGLNDSWAIRWHASAFIANKLTLYPGKSLVRNIGFDGSGVHCTSRLNAYDVKLHRRPVNIAPIAVQEHELAWKLFEAFFRKLAASQVQQRGLQGAAAAFLKAIGASRGHCA